jgi:hypothetical protein
LLIFKIPFEACSITDLGKILGPALKLCFFMNFKSIEISHLVHIKYGT